MLLLEKVVEVGLILRGANVYEASGLHIVCAPLQHLNLGIPARRDALVPHIIGSVTYDEARHDRVAFG